MADTHAREVLDDLADELAAFGAMKGMIFGHHGLKTAGRKVFCFVDGQSLVFKLNGSAYDVAIALPGACVFTPMAERPMRGWVVVPDQHSGEWPELARTAHEWVAEG